MTQLEIGATFYMGLEYHMEEAYKELNKTPSDVSWSPPIAIFSRKYYNEMLNLDHTKKYDFCFIGSINSSYWKRKWVIKFVKKFFTEKSIFVNTDNPVNWIPLGPYDYTNKNVGFCPKSQKNPQSKEVQYRIIQENLYYFETMPQSKFVLCPAGDSSWSFRFYEVLMCKSIPLVESWHHTYRTKVESIIPYKYVLSNNLEEIHNISNDNSWYDTYIVNNTEQFEKYHLLQIVN